MSDPRVVEVEKWQRLYFAAVFVAIALLVVQVATELAWLDWPRALAWLGAALASVLEGRARRPACSRAMPAWACCRRAAR